MKNEIIQLENSAKTNNAASKELFNLEIVEYITDDEDEDNENDNNNNKDDRKQKSIQDKIEDQLDNVGSLPNTPPHGNEKYSNSGDEDEYEYKEYDYEYDDPNEDMKEENQELKQKLEKVMKEKQAAKFDDQTFLCGPKSKHIVASVKELQCKKCIFYIRKKHGIPCN